MNVTIGQRWLFDNHINLVYICQIASIDNKEQITTCEVVQVLQDIGSWGRFVGEKLVVTVVRLTDTPRLWTYLSGQDNPND
jgi:hypothetical protein